jgi:CBS domain-containing protein/ribosome-associated translation inhibitor RaiA
MEPFGMIRDAFTLDYEEPVTRAIGELSKHKTCIVVLRGKKYAGIVDDWTWVSSGSKPAAKVGHIAVHAPTITKKTDLLEVCRLFFSGPYRALPVMDDDKLVGVLARSDAIKMLMDGGLIGKMKVEEIMNKQVPRIEGRELLGKARSMMYGNQYGKLAVVENESLAGVLTAYDIANLLDKPKDKLPFRRSKERVDDIEVSSIMREEVYTIKPGETLEDGARKLIEKDVAALIVESGGKPVGVISARDIFSCVFKPEEVGVDVSGLDENDRMFVDDIQEDAKKMLDKLMKSFEVEHLSLHFKKHGKEYSVHGRLMGRGFVFSASSVGRDLREALKSFLDEMEKMMHKEREEKLQTRKQASRKTERWVD